MPEPWVEVIHRIVSDPGRLTESWYRKMTSSGIAETDYVEKTSVIALLDAAGVVGFFNAIDRVADATGTPLDEKTLADSVALRDDLRINDFAAKKEALEHGPQAR